MSIVPKETIQVIAQSIGINNLSPDVAFALAPDVEYRIREIMQHVAPIVLFFSKRMLLECETSILGVGIWLGSEFLEFGLEIEHRELMQEAVKCMRHSRRTTLTCDDVDSALNLKNVEPVYGFASGDPLRFKRAVGHKDLFYINDKDVDFKDVIEAPLPKVPLDTTIACHWLAIEGVQPAIPENAPVQGIGTLPEGKKLEQKDEGLPVDIKLPVKHVLSKELQLYFDKITNLAMSKSDSSLFKEALVSLATDSGLHPLVPYFTCFIADEVSRGLNDFHLLFALMRVIGSLLQNPHINIEPYLHQLMPSIVTCLVSRRLGNRNGDSHWELRDFTADLVSLICRRFGHVYNSLQTRLTKTLVNAFLDPKKSLTQHYGAIQGLASLGHNVVRLLILPNLESYLTLLEPEMTFEKQKNVMKRHEAWRVYGALLRAAGQCTYYLLKIFPTLPSPPADALWKNKGKILTAAPTGTDLTENHPPLEIMATDGPVDGGPINNSSPSMQEEVRVSAPSSISDFGPSASSRASNGTMSGSQGSIEKVDKRILKTSAVLNQVWKEELQSGRLPVSLSELFGESVSPFIPTPEMSLFL